MRIGRDGYIDFEFDQSLFYLGSAIRALKMKSAFALSGWVSTIFLCYNSEIGDPLHQCTSSDQAEDILAGSLIFREENCSHRREALLEYQLKAREITISEQE